MRVLLDANLSPKRVGRSLRESGHDVRTLAGEPALEGLADQQVMELASADERILVTRNSRDFAPILREWAEGGRTHAGCILIWTLDHSAFAEIVERVERVFAQRPEQEDWRDVTLAI